MKKVLFTILLSIVFNKSLLANDISNASKYTLKECTGYGEIWNVNVDLKKNILTLSYDHLGNNFTSTPISIFKNQNDILVTEKFLLKDIADYRNNYTSDQKITYLNVSSQIEVFPLLNKFTLDLKSIPNSDKKIKRAIKEVFGESQYENTSTYNCMSLQVTKINQNKIKKESKITKVENKKYSQTNQSQSSFFCKDSEGNTHEKSKLSHNSCGTLMKEISKEEYDKVENNNILKTNEKKSQEQTTKVVTVKKNNLDKKSLKEELKYWKELFEEELITKAEYDKKRKELLEGDVQETQVINNETKIVKPKNTNNIKTVTVDMKYKNKNYLNNSLLNQKKWSKISNYCDAKYNNFWEYQECEAQNTKAYKMYNKAKNIYDIYISYGELLSYQALAGEISQQQARYYYESKRNELEDAYNKNKSAKWNNFVNNMLKIQQYSNSLNNNTKPPSFNSHRTCTISSWRGGTVADISCH